MGSESSYPPNYDQTAREGLQLNTDRRVPAFTDRNKSCFVNEPIVISNGADLELAQQLFNLRKNDTCLVTALNYEFVKDNNNSFNGWLQMERIPARLSELAISNLADTIHVYAQSIFGFQRLSKYFRYFLVTPDCLGVNIDQIIKVWHHPNFASMHPLQTVRSQPEMIMSLLNSIEKHLGDLPLIPRFRQFALHYGSPTFEHLKTKLIQYARLYNQGNLPRRLLGSLEQYRMPINYRRYGTVWQNPIQYIHSRPQQINNSFKQPLYHEIPQHNTYHNFHRSEVNQVHPPPISRLQVVQTTSSPQINFQKMFSLPSHHLRTKDGSFNYVQPREMVNNRNQQILGQHFRNQSPPKIVSLFPTAGSYSTTRKLNQSQFIDYKHDFTKSAPFVGVGHHARNKSIHLEKPTSMPAENRPNRLNKSQSNFRPFERQNSISQRPKSEAKPLRSSQMKISFVHNPGAAISINPNNQLINGKENSALPRLLKDAIRQSAQNLKTKTIQQLNSQAPLKVSQAHLVSETPVVNNRYFMKSPQPTMIEPIIDSKAILPKIQKFHQSTQPQLKQSEQQDPWETIMRVVKCQPNHDQLQNEEFKSESMNKTQGQQSTIAEKEKQKVKEQQNMLDHPIVKPLKINTIKPVSPSRPNDSFSSIAGIPHGQPEILADMLRDTDTQSINNSMRNFYSNFSGQDFSQIVDLSSPLDFRLSSKDRHSLFKLEEESEINKMNMSSSKVFEQELNSNKMQAGFTSLDLMQKLRIAETIHKDELECSPKKNLQPSQFSEELSLKHRSRSKQFNQDVAKLGFRINSQESNSQDIGSSKKKGIKNYEETINEWTPTYDEASGRAVDGKSKYSWQMEYAANYISVPHQWKTRQPEYEPKFQFRDETSNAVKFNDWDDREYKFDWDPQLLADMQSKAYNNSAYSG